MKDSVAPEQKYSHNRHERAPQLCGEMPKSALLTLEHDFLPGLLAFSFPGLFAHELLSFSLAVIFLHGQEIMVAGNKIDWYPVLMGGWLMPVCWPKLGV